MESSEKEDGQEDESANEQEDEQESEESTEESEFSEPEPPEDIADGLPIGNLHITKSTDRPNTT